MRVWGGAAVRESGCLKPFFLPNLAVLAFFIDVMRLCSSPLEASMVPPALRNCSPLRSWFPSPLCGSPFMAEARDEAKADQQKEGPMMALRSWEWHQLGAASFDFLRVNTLNLNSLHLVGSLSPSIGNLTFLTGLNLELNNFHGQIPQELGRLSRLRALNLTNNSSGEIPANLSRCSNLVYFRLGFNNLIGRIPSWLGSYPKVVRMQLHYNNLTGPVPDSL
ncbi:LRR receptor kinase SERL2-like [Vitis vinifera]|uniref:LRR receptor kinase SERL2-like n=1 Tax=Vitis vinifera TaxID=29760 RepID=UPI002882E979|nr:LRR receptor kinase SERL2-like [Vitis vinifera]